MKYEPVTIARSELARRVTERSQRIIETREIVPCPGEPAPGRSALDQQHWADEQRAMSIARRCTSLRQTQHGDYHTFVASKHAHAGDTGVNRRIIQRLVDKGQMAWINSCHSAVVLTERGRGE
jgi:hypothetical protein